MTTSRPAGRVAHAQTARTRRLPAYSAHARSYESDTGAFQPYRQAIVDALPLRRGEVVLDVGCGTGLCCGMLRDKVGPEGGVIGIEESPEMLAVAREHIAGGLRRVHCVSNDGLRIFGGTPSGIEDQAANQSGRSHPYGHDKSVPYSGSV